MLDSEVIEAAFWGLIQGLTEFLPISSSGHLVLVPELLGRDAPSLATSAVLHLGTLVAVLVYFRHDLAQVFRWTETGKRLLRMLIIGTIPAAALGLLFKSSLEDFNDTPRAVAVAMFFMGVVMVATIWIPRGQRTIEDSKDRDAWSLGFGQALALIPGISRSGSTITVGLLRGFERAEAARYSFLLGIPAIAGAGLLEFVDLASSSEGIPTGTFVGMAVAGVTGYVAIAALLWVIRKAGLAPFGIYCILFATMSFFLVG